MTTKTIISKPVCPYCDTEMYEVSFEGHFADFTHWDCACDELENIQVIALDDPEADNDLAKENAELKERLRLVREWLEDPQGTVFSLAEILEEEIDHIDMYREESPDNEVVEVLNVRQTKQPLGICEDHIKAWDRVNCPLCDVLYLYERLRLALEVIDDAVCLLSEMPEIEAGVDDEDQDEANRGRACINLSKFLDYAKSGMSGGKCSCDEVGEGRCSKHGWETFAASLQWAKKGKGA